MLFILLCFLGVTVMLQINTDNLYRVLKDFYILTGIRIVVFDGEFQEILAYPPQLEGFCGVLRQDPLADAKCRASDRSGILLRMPNAVPATAAAVSAAPRPRALPFTAATPG